MINTGNASFLNLALTQMCFYACMGLEQVSSLVGNGYSRQSVPKSHETAKPDKAIQSAAQAETFTRRVVDDYDDQVLGSPCDVAVKQDDKSKPVEVSVDYDEEVYKALDVIAKGYSGPLRAISPKNNPESNRWLFESISAQLERQRKDGSLDDVAVDYIFSILANKVHDLAKLKEYAIQLEKEDDITVIKDAERVEINRAKSELAYVQMIAEIITGEKDTPPQTAITVVESYYEKAIEHARRENERKEKSNNQRMASSAKLDQFLYRFSEAKSDFKSKTSSEAVFARGQVARLRQELKSSTLEADAKQDLIAKTAKRISERMPDRQITSEELQRILSSLS